MMALLNDDVAESLDELAEEIRSTTDFNLRASAIAKFRTVCHDNSDPLNPAVEAANRCVTLMNPLRP
jgi:predicted transcriptional regulator